MVVTVIGAIGIISIVGAVGIVSVVSVVSVVGIVSVVNIVVINGVLLGGATKWTFYKHNLFTGRLVPVTSGADEAHLQSPHFLHSSGKAGRGGTFQSFDPSRATGHG